MVSKAIPDEPGVADGQPVQQVHEDHHNQEDEAEQNIV